MPEITCGQCHKQFEAPLADTHEARASCPTCGSTQRVIEAAARAGAVSFTSNVTISVKSNFSVHHMLAAAHFARLSHQIEKGKTKQLAEDTATEYRAYITGAILSAVSAVEAAINEFYIDAVDKNHTALSGLEPFAIDSLAQIWESVERNTILNKFQLALIMTRKEKFDSGQTPYQDIDHLIRLRNALVHYRPEWDTQLKEHRKLEERLHNKFPISPFAHANDVFFPKKCLSHGCAAWSVRIGLDFLGAFFERMGSPQRFTIYGSRMRTTFNA